VVIRYDTRKGEKGTDFSGNNSCHTIGFKRQGVKGG